MNNYNVYDLKLSGSEGIFFVIVLCFLLALLTAARIGAADNSPTNLMVKIKKRTSLVLFLYPFKRPVTVWAVVMQVFNYITLISALLVYKVFKLNLHKIDRTFAIVIGVYMGILTILFVIDVVIYGIKHKEFF